jgi:hypothetical protein
VLGELLHLLRALEKRSASAAVTDSIAHRLANPVASSPIQSIQRGTIDISVTSNEGNATATITSVTTAKAALGFLGHTATSPANSESGGRVELTNATTVTGYASSSGSTQTRRVGYQVVEYK